MLVVKDKNSYLARLIARLNKTHTCSTDKITEAIHILIHWGSFSDAFT